MGLVDSITQTRFVGTWRLQIITVVVEIFESPVRARLLVDGKEQGQQDLPARFPLDDEAWVEVAAKGMAVTECSIVAGGTRTSLELAPDSGIRRYVHWADTSGAAGLIRGLVFFLIIPVLFLIGLSGLLNVAALERPLSWVGVSQPVDLPIGTSWWYVPLAVILLFALGVEEDIRKAWRRFLVTSRTRVDPRAEGTPAATTTGSGAALPTAPGTTASFATPSADAAAGKGEWETRREQVGERVGGGFDAVTKSRFTGRHAGRELSVVFDYFDEPTHARLLIDGDDQGNKGVPARFDLGGGATLEADATQWAVTECAVVVGDRRTRLTPINAQTERAHDRFFAAHPRLEGFVRTVGGLVILVAGALGAIDLYNLAFRIGSRIVENADIPTDLPVISQVIGWLPDSIDLPIGLDWWQAVLISAIPALFEFDRDVRRSNQVFGPGTREPQAPETTGARSSGAS